MIPRYPQVEDDVAVRARIVSAQGTIEQVSLNYSIGSVDEVMEMVIQDSIYEAVVPRQSEGIKAQKPLYRWNRG